MARFPKIASPCPYKGALSEILDQNALCGLCHRQVHDLSAMTEGQRKAFLKSCSGEVCVSYRVPATMAAMAFMATAVPAAAQQAATASPSPASAPAPSTAAVTYDYDGADVVGGLPILTSSWRYVRVAEASRLRWNETHRRLDSRKGREKNG